MPASRSSAPRSDGRPLDAPTSGPASPRLRPVVRAAGAVVTRPGREVLLVHRPRYDDWSFPKGKVDPGEHVLTAATREVAEETGLRVALGAPLAPQRYEVVSRQGRRDKTVAYWSARVVGDDDDVSAHVREDEIDQVAWVHRDEARERLTYAHDRATLDEAYATPRRTGALVVLRHAEARARSAWRAPDPVRPLLALGHDQSRRWVAPLASYAPDVVMTSPSLRCTQTVAPYVEAAGVVPDEVAALSEEHADAGLVAELCDRLVTGRVRALLCTHRPVLPLVWEALGLPDPRLAKGEALVVHHRRGRVVATESHSV